MALFVLGDTHLSLGASKPMDIFPGWNDYVERLEKNWRKLIKPEDTIVLAGDISWAMRLTDTRKDFEFLQSLPGQKIIMKGNHDYWWSTVNKMNAYLKAEGFDTLHILHNNSYSVEGYALCGTRGWLFDAGEAHDEKVMNREIGRLRMSLDAADADRLRAHDGQPLLHRGRRDELRGEHRALSADARQDDILLHHFALPSLFSNDVTAMASNGQMSAQMPQPVHCEASTMILPSSTTMPGQPISRMHFLHLRQAS